MVYFGTDELIATTESVQVPVGGYYLVVEDENGCQGTDEVSVEQSNPISFTYEIDDVTCFWRFLMEKYKFQ